MMSIRSVKGALGMLLLLISNQKVAANSLTKRGLGGDIADIATTDVNDSNGSSIDDSKKYKMSPCNDTNNSLSLGQSHSLLFSEWWDLKINSQNAIGFSLVEGINFGSRKRFVISSEAQDKYMNVNKFGIIQLDNGSGEVVFVTSETENCYKILAYNDQSPCYFKIQNEGGNASCSNRLSDGTETGNAETFGRVTDSWMLVEV